MNASHPNLPAAAAPADGPALRPLSICVDDLGLHPGVTGSVLQLAELGHISATSAMTQMGHWPEAAQALAPVRGQLDVGLHFNLTESSPEGPGMPLGGLIRRSVLRQLDVAQLASSFESQLSAFASVWGSLPDHIDGHQHVHQFPQVRQAMWQVLDRWRDRHPGWKPWLRASVPALPAGLKGQVLAALGGRALARECAARGLPCSAGLTGIYGFDGPPEAYLARWQHWLAHSPAGSVLMCHPAMAEVPGDAIAAARLREHAVLVSAAAHPARQGARATRGLR